MMSRLLKLVFALACAALPPGPASAQSVADWPSKPIKFIVPVPPGQSVDIIGRLIAEKLRPLVGQPIIIENKPGAGAMLGTAYAAKQPADGYTFLLAGAGALSISPHIYPKIEYDPLRDFTMILRVAVLPMLIVVNPQVPANNIQELIALAKAKPGSLTYSSSGVGSTQHLIMALFASTAGIELRHIPYKGSAGSMTDVMSGEISMLADTIPVLGPNVRAGKLRALGVTSIKRSPFMPEVPTIDEQGLKGFEIASWAGILAPAGTPAPILQKMSADMQKVMKDPEVLKKFQELGMATIDETLAEAQAFLKQDLELWGKAVKTSGAKNE